MAPLLRVGLDPAHGRRRTRSIFSARCGGQVVFAPADVSLYQVLQPANWLNSPLLLALPSWSSTAIFQPSQAVLACPLCPPIETSLGLGVRLDDCNTARPSAVKGLQGGRNPQSFLALVRETSEAIAGEEEKVQRSSHQAHRRFLLARPTHRKDVPDLYFYLFCLSHLCLDLLNLLQTPI